MELKLGPETEEQIDFLYSTLEESLVHLKNVREYIWEEIKTIKGITSHDSADYKNLVFSLGNVGSLLNEQFDKIRGVIRSAMALPVCIIDLTESRKEEKKPALTLKS
jgi:hypothetical protein